MTKMKTQKRNKKRAPKTARRKWGYCRKLRFPGISRWIHQSVSRNMLLENTLYDWNILMKLFTFSSLLMHLLPMFKNLWRTNLRWKTPHPLWCQVVGWQDIVDRCRRYPGWLLPAYFVLVSSVSHHRHHRRSRRNRLLHIPVPHTYNEMCGSRQWENSYSSGFIPIMR